MVKSTDNRAQSRRTARLGVVQALYQMELAETDLSDILADFGARGLAKAGEGDETLEGDFRFFSDLVTGVVQSQRELDPKINDTLNASWRLDRLDSILRAILRAGAYELAHRPDVPAKVVINEYLEITHAFFDDEQVKFANGVLDRLAHDLRPGDQAERAG